MDENKKRALTAALAQIDKQFGKGTVMLMGDKNVEAHEVIGTGSLMLDMALGIGGLPRGRVVEIYGPESSGKTTVALHAIANVQRAGGIAAFIDAEHALDPIYAAKLGVNVDDLGDHGVDVHRVRLRQRIGALQAGLGQEAAKRAEDLGYDICGTPETWTSSFLYSCSGVGMIFSNGSELVKWRTPDVANIPARTLGPFMS